MIITFFVGLVFGLLLHMKVNVSVKRTRDARGRYCVERKH